MFDLHTHNERCYHAIGRIEEYIEEAIQKRLKIIGISDHSPFFYAEEEQLIPRVAMAKSEFPNYVSEVLKLKEKYKDQIEVLLGVESDFFPEYIDLYKENYKRYPLDYIIGSVHFSSAKAMEPTKDGFYRGNIFNTDRWEGLNEEEMNIEKERYYSLIEQSAQSGLFDILGHIDCMKATFPTFSELDFAPVEKALKTIAEEDVVIEINTSGKLKKCGGWYPSDEILERAFFYGVKVTFGSDAHEPLRVADEWLDVKNKLLEIGYKEWAIFRNRRRYMIKM